MLVRRLVSGVRSSCPASAISWACRSREELSERSIWLNDSASRARSPVASISIGVSSVVAVICSTAADSWRTGRRLDRATVTPTMAATHHPGHPEDDQHHPQRAEDVVGRRPAAGRSPGRSCPGPRSAARRRCGTPRPASDTPDRAEKPRPSRATASSSRTQHQPVALVGHEERAAVGPDRRPPRGRRTAPSARSGCRWSAGPRPPARGPAPPRWSPARSSSAR